MNMNRFLLFASMIAFFCTTGNAAQSVIKRTYQLIEKTDAVWEPVFDFVWQCDTLPFAIETEHSLKLLLRKVPEKTTSLTTSLTHYQTLPMMTSIEMIKRVLQKIRKLEKSYKYLKKNKHSDQEEQAILKAYDQLIALKDDCKNTIAFIKKTDTYFAEFYSTYNQGENIVLRTGKILWGTTQFICSVIIIVLGIDFLAKTHNARKVINEDY